MPTSIRAIRHPTRAQPFVGVCRFRPSASKGHEERNISRGVMEGGPCVWGLGGGSPCFRAGHRRGSRTLSPARRAVKGVRQSHVRTAWIAWKIPSAWPSLNSQEFRQTTITHGMSQPPARTGDGRAIRLAPDPATLILNGYETGSSEKTLTNNTAALPPVVRPDVSKHDQGREGSENSTFRNTSAVW